jgi:hypothetical protein
LQDLREHVVPPPVGPRLGPDLLTFSWPKHRPTCGRIFLATSGRIEHNDGRAATNNGEWAGVGNLHHAELRPDGGEVGVAK